MTSKWIVRAYDQNAGGLRWRYSTFQAEVFHPSCPDLRLGFACAHEAYLMDDGCYRYGFEVYSNEKFIALLPQIREETITHALQEARKNLAKLKTAEDYSQYADNL